MFEFTLKKLTKETFWFWESEWCETLIIIPDMKHEVIESWFEKGVLIKTFASVREEVLNGMVKVLALALLLFNIFSHILNEKWGNAYQVFILFKLSGVLKISKGKNNTNNLDSLQKWAENISINTQNVFVTEQIQCIRIKYKTLRLNIVLVKKEPGVFCSWLQKWIWLLVLYSCMHICVHIHTHTCTQQMQCEAASREL